MTKAEFRPENFWHKTLLLNLLHFFPLLHVFLLFNSIWMIVSSAFENIRFDVVRWDTEEISQRLRHLIILSRTKVCIYQHWLEIVSMKILFLVLFFKSNFSPPSCSAWKHRQNGYLKPWNSSKAFWKRAPSSGWTSSCI